MRDPSDCDVIAYLPPTNQLKSYLKGGSSMANLNKTGFEIGNLLATAGLGRRIMKLTPKAAFFSQGDPADSVFYLQEGRAKVTVVSVPGKEATIRLLSAGDFFGEGAL